jgi:hypothetical protein
MEIVMVQATVVVSGGTTPYTYQWTGGTPFGGNTPTASSTGGICSGMLTLLLQIRKVVLLLVQQEL